MAQLHGGTVHAYNAGIGQGSTFMVTLPLLANTDIPDELVQGLPQAQGTERVLVIQTTPIRPSPWPCSCACRATRWKSPPTASAVWPWRRSCSPASLACDIGLPGTGGYEVAAQLRLRADRAPLMIALSGYGAHGDIDRALSAGFHKHLVKPADVEKLLQTISQVLHPKEQQHAPR